MTNEDATKNYESMRANVMEEVKELFRPEFLNRIDEIIVFHPLELEDAKKIVRLMLNEVKARVKESLESDIEFTDELIEHVANIGFDQNYGARPLRRTIQSKIEDVFAEKILVKEINYGDKIIIDYKNNEIVFNKLD